MPRFRRSSFVCLLTLAAAVALLGGCGGGDRYEIVSGEDGAAYRLDKRTGEVILVNGVRSWRVLSPEPEEFATADLRNVLVQLQKGYDDGEHYALTLYNGTAIEFSEVTFRIRARLYRTRVNLQPFATDDVGIRIIPGDTPPEQVVIVSARGVRRGT